MCSSVKLFLGKLNSIMLLAYWILFECNILVLKIDTSVYRVLVRPMNDFFFF